MRDELEQHTIEYIMGAAMMEPDVRIETNKAGFCKEHFEQMRACKNRLSLALMLQTHLQELQKHVFDDKKLFETKDGKHRKTVEKVSKINNDCFVCNKIEWGMSRLMNTVFELYGKERDFRKQFSEQQYLCLPHYKMLMSRSETDIEKVYRSEFREACTALVKGYLDELEKDVSHYCKMYDYRNTGKDADWGNSKDSIERAIKFLTTR
jgi:hypothetical protein